MTGRARDHRDNEVPPAPQLRVEGDDVVSFGGREGRTHPRRVALVVVAAAVVAVAAGAGWWTTRTDDDGRRSVELDRGGRLVVDASSTPTAGDEVEVRIEVGGRQRCQNVVRLELTGRPLCGAGAAVAVVAPAACRVRFEPTSGPPVEAERVRLGSSGLAVAGAVVDARTVTPAVRAVVVDDRGGRQLLSDVARRVAAGADLADVAAC